MTVADQRVHGTTGERPAVRFARAEAAALVPVERRPPPRERLESRVVPRDGYVAVDTNRYPVPLGWVGHQVGVHIRVDEVVVRLDGEEPVHHPRLEGKHEIARWRGEPRRAAAMARLAPEGPPRFDLAYLAAVGDVEVRVLAGYEALAAGGGR